MQEGDFHRPRALFAAAVVLFAAAACAAQDSAKKADPAQWAPKDAVFFAGVTDLTELVESAKKSSGWKLLEDPAAKNLPQFNIVNVFCEKFSERLAKALEMDASSLKNPFGGTLALYITLKRGEASTQPEVTIVAGIKDRALLREYYEKATRKFKQMADSHESVSFGSNSIDYFKTKARGDGESEDESDGDEGAPDPNSLDLSNEEDVTAMLDQVFGEMFTAETLPENLSLCATENHLVVGLTPDHVKDALRRERGGESLRDHEDYKSIGKHFPQAGPLRFFVNLPRIFEAARAEDADSAAEMDAVLGTKCLRSIIGHYELGGEKYEARMEALVLMSGERTGLAKILSMKNADAAPPKFVSTDHSMYFGAALDVGATLDEVERIVKAVSPGDAEQMRSSMVVPIGEDKKLDIRKDIIDHLKPPATFSMGVRTPYAPDSVRMLLSIGHRDRDALQKAIGALVASAPMLQEREVRGTPVYETFGFAVAIGSEAVLFGTSPAVDAALVGAGDQTLAADKTYKRVAEAAPSDCWGVVYIDSRRLFESSVELLKHQDELQGAMFTNPSAMIAASIAASFSGGAKPGQADELRALLKYQAPAIMTISTTSDGLRITGLSMKPDSTESK